MQLLVWHPIVRSCDDNHKEVTTDQNKLYSQDHPWITMLNIGEQRTLT